MGYGWNWDRCAAVAMAAGPEETLFQATGRQLHKEAFG